MAILTTFIMAVWTARETEENFFPRYYLQFFKRGLYFTRAVR